MTVQDATKELINSKYFHDCAKLRNKEGARLRMFRVRFKRDELSTGACIEMLEFFKYKISYNIIEKPELFFHEDCDDKSM